MAKQIITPDSLLQRRLSRRQFLRTAGMAGAGLVAAGCVATAEPAPTAAPTAPPKPTESPIPAVIFSKPGLAAGMIGGPTGFDGAQRYQYGPDSPAGRAMEGLRNLPPDKKPERLVIMSPSGAVGHWSANFPGGAPTAQQIFEEECGIKLEIIGTDESSQFAKIIQDTITQAGEYDIYSFWGNNSGTLTEAGAFTILDEFVEKHKPEWDKAYIGGQLTVESHAKYAGHYVAVPFDGDYQSWNYRRDLLEDPREMAKFKARYGWDLQWAETWEQLDQLSEFFHRPDEGMFGCTDLRASVWGLTNWIQRYVSFANPNQHYFDLGTGRPLINSPAGIQATREFVDTLKWHSPDALNWGRPQQYDNMTAGGAAITCAFPSMPKILDTPANAASQVVDKLRTGISPGRIIDGRLIRRSVWWPSIAFGVSTQTPYAEAAYLFLQWGGSPSMFTFMVGNPVGYFDPFLTSDFEDPVVVGSYHEYHIPTLKGVIERGVPPLNINGADEYETALDINLLAVAAGDKTAGQAMADCETEWEKITDRLGRDKQVRAIASQVSSWPTIVDEPTIQS